MSLDDELEAIVGSIVHPLFTSRKQIAGDEQAYIQRKAEQIKQAFVEAGYVHLTGTQEQQTTIANMMLGNTVMTGRSFYEEFKDNINKWDRVELETKRGPADFMNLYLVMECAREAAGIEESHDTTA